MCDLDLDDHLIDKEDLNYSEKDLNVPRKHLQLRVQPQQQIHQRAQPLLLLHLKHSRFLS